MRNLKTIPYLNGRHFNGKIHLKSNASGKNRGIISSSSSALSFFKRTWKDDSSGLITKRILPPFKVTQ